MHNRVLTRADVRGFFSMVFTVGDVNFQGSVGKHYALRQNIINRDNA
jgi:hypothetical protein